MRDDPGLVTLLDLDGHVIDQGGGYSAMTTPTLSAYHAGSSMQDGASHSTIGIVMPKTAANRTNSRMPTNCSPTSSGKSMRC